MILPMLAMCLAGFLIRRVLHGCLISVAIVFTFTCSMLYNRLERCVFGFKKHGTDMCIYAFKELVLKYHTFFKKAAR